jgi:hypothetical protein
MLQRRGNGLARGKIVGAQSRLWKEMPQPNTTDNAKWINRRRRYPLLTSTERLVTAISLYVEIVQSRCPDDAIAVLLFKDEARLSRVRL